MWYNKKKHNTNHDEQDLFTVQKLNNILLYTKYVCAIENCHK